MNQHLSLVSLAQRLAGQSAYERGSELYDAKKVLNLKFTQQSISAQVLGTKLYQVELTRVADSYDGGCNCPASEGFDFCKHCVAVLLEYADQVQQFEDMKSGPPSERVQAYISQLDESELKSAMYQLVSDSPDLFEHWLLIADISSERLRTGDLKKYFTKALPLKDVWRHDQVRNYFEKAFTQLSRLYEAIHLLDANQRFELCEFVLQRYDKILERIDDSAGFRLAIFHLVERHFAEAFKACPWTTAHKSSYLVTLFNSNYNHITFESIPTKFIEDGDDVLRHAFYKELRKGIDKQLINQVELTTSQGLVLKQMCKQLIEHFLFQGQEKSALLYLTHIAETIDDYAQIIELASSTEQFTIANEYIALALGKCRMHEDKTKIERLALACMLKSKNNKGALELAWSIFETTCKVEDFKKIESLTEIKRAGAEQTSPSKLMKKAENTLRNRAGMNKTKASNGASGKSIENLVEFYIYIKNFDKALSMAKQYELPPDLVHEVAFCSLLHRPKASFNLYRQLSLLYPQLGGPQDFESCIELLIELQVGIQNDDSLVQKFTHLLAELAEIFRHKTGFIERLNASFPDGFGH